MSQCSQASGIGLRDCLLNVFVMVIVIVGVFVFVREHGRRTGLPKVQLHRELPEPEVQMQEGEPALQKPMPQQA